MKIVFIQFDELEFGDRNRSFLVVNGAEVEVKDILFSKNKDYFITSNIVF